MSVDIFTFLLAAVALAITPGPSILNVVAFSLRFGTVAGLISALGVNVGSYLLILIAAFGLYPVLQFAPGLIVAIQTFGGLYIIYLGYRLWPRNVTATRALSNQPADSKGTMFRRGFITTLLNPKDILFYIMFVPSFIRVDEGSDSFLFWFLVLSVVYAMIGFASKATIAIFAGSLKNLLTSKKSSNINYVSSILLFGLGIFLLSKAIVSNWP